MSQVKTGKATKGRAKVVPPPSGLSCFLLIPLGIVFFCGGIYIGSKFGDNVTQEIKIIKSVGLPGTNNNFMRWSSSNSNKMVEDSFANSLYSDKSSTNLLRGSANKVQTNIPDISHTESNSFAEIVAPEDLRLSLHAQSRSYMIAPSGLDNSDILVATWIYLDETSLFDNDMRTVFSNKLPGCDTSEGQYGLSMFVNAWQQQDHKLYIEFGGKGSGCYKVDSQAIVLESKRWYHVAVYASSTSTTLYIDGKEVNSMEMQHEVQTINPLFVGVYDNMGDYPFYGNISNLAIVHGIAHTKQSIGAILSLLSQGNRNRLSSSVSGLYAFYSLNDAATETPHSVAKDSTSHAKHGKYSFPVTSAQVSGVHIALNDGVGGRAVTEDMRRDSDIQGRERRESVKEGMQHAWAGYKQYGWGRDEVKPISNRGQDNWGGMGVTLVDSLDTLWIMGLKKEFQEARDWVANSLSFDRAGSVSVFETTIRELGGLLAAYDLSKDKVFLDKAKQLGDKLMPAFRTQSGIPTAMVDFRSGAGGGGWSGGNAILSELGSLQIEFRFLAQGTGDLGYEHSAMKPMQVMHSKHAPNGLYPIKISTRDGNFADSQVTFGALGDSFYEYLLKIWLQGGRKEPWLRDMYDRAMDGVMEKLLLASDVTGLAFLSDWNGRTNNRKMDHLVCFMPGVLALGAYTDPQGINSERAQRDLAVSKALMYTCYQMYHRTASGISAEYVEFPHRQDFVAGASAQFYILRPETAESLFVLGQLTGDPVYRDWAWEIWQAINKACRTNTAYGAIRNVNQPNGGGIDDRMESFFLAETLKYLYLAQDPDNEIDLMKIVFNTEAHPMRILDDSHIPIPPS